MTKLFRKLRKRYYFYILLTPVLVIFTLFAASELEYSSEYWATYNYYMTYELDSLNDLGTLYELNQKMPPPWPPANDVFYWNLNPNYVPFNPDRFHKKFLDKLIGIEKEDGFFTYPIIILENPTTRKRDVMNADGQVIASIRPSKDYDFVDYIIERHGEPPAYVLEDEERLEQWYAARDPSRIVMYGELILEEELVKYAELRAAQAEWDDLMQPMMMMVVPGGGPTNVPAVTNLMFYSVKSVSNGVEMVIAYPYPPAFTNIDIYSLTNFVPGATKYEHPWELLCTTNIDLTTNFTCLVDTDPVDMTNVQRRFYHLWNADYDGDYDGLADGREAMLHDTDRYDWDSDGDGISDWHEFYTYGEDDSPLGLTYWLLPFIATFESSNSYAVGTLFGQQNWIVSSVNGAEVQTIVVTNGTQAVRVLGPEEKITHLLASTNTSIATEMYVFLNDNAFVQPTNLPSNASSLISYNATNGIVALDGNGSGSGTWTIASGTLLAGQWVKIGIEQNYSSKTWNLLINGVTNLTGLGFVNDAITQPRAINVESGGSGELYVDNIIISEN